MVALLILLYAIAIRGRIDMTMSVLFIAVYCLYVAVVFRQDRLHQVEANSDIAKKAALAQ